MNNTKPKIALCISGEPRNTMQCFPYIYESILRPYLGYQVDVYIHTFKPYRTIKSYSPLKYKIESEDEYVIYDWYAQSIGLDIVKYHDTPFRNTVLMYYGIQQVYELTKDKEYDYYIRYRPDLMLYNSFDLSCILNNLKLNNKDMWVPHSYYGENWREVLNDQIAICNPKSFKIYANIIDNLKKLITQTQSFYPEGILSAAINNHSLNVERGDMKMYLVRKSILKTHPIDNFLNLE